DLTQITDSTLDESVVGDGTVQSNDIDIDASEGSSVAFGDGATSSAETQDVDIDGNYGTVQVADDGNQTGVTDNSVNDSYNTTDRFYTDGDYTDASVNDSYNAADSFNTDVDASDHSVNDSYTDQSDDDFVDVDLGEPAAADPGLEAL